MTTFTAVLGSLVLGITAAWWMYFYKSNVRNPWLLAFFRFVWFGMLAFAILSPDVLRLEERSFKEHVTLLVDTSESVLGDAEGLAQEIAISLKDLNVPYELRSATIENVPSSGKWAYVGDLHLEKSWKDVLPESVFVVEGTKMEAPKLIESIVLPSKVRTGERVQVDVLGEARVAFTSTIGGKEFKGSRFSFTAPQREGALTMYCVATFGTTTDTLSIDVQVVESLTRVAVVYNVPHPHVGMSIRTLERLGVRAETYKWNEIDRLKEFNGPLIAIGGKEGVLKKLQSICNQPILWMDDAQPKQREVLSTTQLPFGQKDKAIPVHVKQAGTGVTVEGGLIQARGIHWFSSSQANAASYEAFQELIDHLLELHEPHELRVHIPQRVFSDAQVQTVLALTNSLNEVEPATYTLEVRRGEEAVLIPSIVVDQGAGSASFALKTPGVYEIKAEALFEGISYSTSSTLQVDAEDVELNTPYNEQLESYWKQEGTDFISANDYSSTWSATSALHETAFHSLSTRKPQHSNVLYWGLVFLLASMEWLIRRNQGAI